MDFFIAGVVSLDGMKYNEDENEVEADIQKAGSLLVATSSNGSEPLPGLQLTALTTRPTSDRSDRPSQTSSYPTMSSIPSRGSPARQNTTYENYDNRDLHINIFEGTVNSYQTINNNNPGPDPDPLCMSSGSLHKLSHLKITQANSRNVVLLAPHLTLERVLIPLDVPNPHDLGSFAE